MEGPLVDTQLHACYLLQSHHAKFRDHAYVGFTKTPWKRIRQHNGEIANGAKRTSRKQPWEMVAVVTGFPSSVAALQFEWAWQNPLKSVQVKKGAARVKGTPISPPRAAAVLACSRTHWTR